MSRYAGLGCHKCPWGMQKHSLDAVQRCVHCTTREAVGILYAARFYCGLYSFWYSLLALSSLDLRECAFWPTVHTSPSGELSRPTAQVPLLFGESLQDNVLMGL